ncbi:MAG: hypothetical protein ABSC32_01185 [Steroidobacteraceae bacterium]|jgi:hypothetical protein
MTNTPKKRFLVLYLVPAQVIEDWGRTDPEKRKPAEEKMRADWQQWMREHAAMIAITEAAGKTKSVAAGGVSDTKNDIMLYSIVEAESHEIAAKAFERHPHLEIPRSSIQLTELRPMGPQ